MTEPNPQDLAERRGDRVHRINASGNLLLALAKGVGGWLSGSRALTADAVHSIGDLATSAVAWVSFKVARQPPDEDHHFGHGKAEAAAGVFVGLVLLWVGVSVLGSAVRSPGAAYESGRAALALGFAVVSFAGNLWLARLTREAADELASAGLRALERDNSADALTSVLVMAGVLGGTLGWTWCEPIATGVIGIFIAWMGISSVREGLGVLMDRVSDPEMRGRIETVARAVAGVRGVQRVRVHPLGGALRADVEVSVDENLSVRAGHDIAHAVENAILDGEPTMVQVSVHVNPDDPSQSGEVREQVGE